ncbi:MAG: helix-turn-helix transcriptional regulator [Microthrixaceae bacterium]|jgi:AcrR family transcriptional regulator|nr:helix-turn-helix transcriptional regulator [Microthrixaceae bacterium]
MPADTDETLTAPEAEVERLPRGRHSLSREEVAERQRNRILMGLVDTMAEKGFVPTTVADVIKAAGVSRETFYQLFTSKQDAFMAAFDAAAELAVGTMGVDPAMPDTRSGEPNVAGSDHDIRLKVFAMALQRYLTNLVENPALARMFLIEVYAAGPEALERRLQFQGRLVDRMVGDLGLGESNRFACELTVAATAAMVTPLLVAGDLGAIESLGPRLVEALDRLVVWPA